MSALVVMMATASAASPYAQAALKIVVIQGENAVNIIQQKTALAPIVEIRDRNDLPVSGVPVTFTISGENVVFGGGLRAVSVTTNAAGRATVDTFTAIASGPVRVTATATLQGQTATAAITQANFATAAQAAQAGAAAGGGGSAGAAGAVGAGAATGGGLGAGAIAAIAGGVGAGAFAATKLSGGANGSDNDGGGAGSGGGGQTCTFTVSPTSLTAEASGGTRAINVTAAPGCNTTSWNANSNLDWVTLDASSGTGTGSVTATIAPNQPNTAPRSGPVIVAQQAVNIAQARGCEFTVEPTIVNLPGTGGSAAVTVTPSPSGCTPSPWTTQPAQNSNFISLSPTSGSGGMIVTVTVTPNPTPFAGRSDAVIIAGVAVSVRQAAGPGGF